MLAVNSYQLENSYSHTQSRTDKSLTRNGELARRLFWFLVYAHSKMNIIQLYLGDYNCYISHIQDQTFSMVLHDTLLELFFFYYYFPHHRFQMLRRNYQTYKEFFLNMILKHKAPRWVDLKDRSLLQMSRVTLPKYIWFGFCFVTKINSSFLGGEQI